MIIYIYDQKISHKINYFKKIMLALHSDLAYNKSYNYDTGNYFGLLVIKIKVFICTWMCKILVILNGNPLALFYVEWRA